MQINEALRDLFNLSKKPLVLAIDGPAGSGKSTLASEIARAFAGTYTIEVIHLDELYNGWDQPLSVDLFERIAELISAQHLGQSIDLALYDWEINSFSRRREIKAAELLIIEGVGSSNQALQKDLTTSIWLDIDASVGLARVLERDGEEITEEMAKWQKMERQYFERDLTRERADFILSTQ
jgi:uridine kinase